MLPSRPSAPVAQRSLPSAPVSKRSLSLAPVSKCSLSSESLSQPSLPPKDSFSDGPVGFIGCGRMGLAIASVLAKASIAIFLGSRDGGEKASKCALRIGGMAQSGSYADTVVACRVLYVCLANPGRPDPVCEFIDGHRDALAGKILIDPSNPWGYARLLPPAPHQSALTFHAEVRHIRLVRL